MPPPAPSGPTTDSLFVAWLARQEVGEEEDSFEALCREHPGALAGLRELHSQWLHLRGMLAQAGLGGSLSEKLKTQYGSGVDPQVTLEGEEQARGEFSSEVLSRLAGRSPASTRYRVKGEVAHGGMGAVLRVWDEDLRRHLAMKVMLGKGVPKQEGDTPKVDQRMLARFLEEAQVTGQLDHPGIVPVHELGLDAEGRVYFTMKLVKGKTLKDVFDELARGEGGWSQTRVLSLILKVCEAMSYAHAKGVIHRDLKPANIMVGKFGEVYVMDWGLARVLGREDDKDIRPRVEPGLTTSEVRSDRRDRTGEMPDMSLVTMEGDVVGTPAYMPPEQAQGDLAAMGPHSDVYAVGAMLYHLLVGHMPYVPPGARLNNYAVWRSVQAGPPEGLEKEASDAPVELAAICDKAMWRDAKGRYRDMAALAADLSAFVEGRVVSAYETGAWAEARKWVRRNKLLAASLASAVLAVVMGGVAFAVKANEATNAATFAKEQAERADAKADEAARNAQEAQQNLVLAQKNEQEAKLNLTLAQRNEAEAKAQTAKVLRLSDVKVLQELERDADDLWPAHPDKIPAMESWLVDARELADRLPGHRETLARMRARAQSWTGEERARDRETHPRAGELAEKKAELEGLIAQLERGLEGEAQETADKRVTELEPEVAALTEEVECRRTWSFDTAEDQWQHDVLSELVGNLEGLDAGLLAGDVITADHGWSVPKRLAFAQELEAGFAEDGEHSRAWAEALPGIRDAYPRLDLAPQVGLLPIGPDPESGLWEFAHVMTGVPAERGPDGKLVLSEETGLVLVLLPGGSFWMGAQANDASARNYDPQAEGNEGPVHEVELSAYFLSKYEMTQGQWLRLTERNPSFYQKSALAQTLLHPVEQLSWKDCLEWLPRAGLMLPSEAQWEYGARAGTDTPWWTGAERESLREKHAANLADQAAERAGVTWAEIKDWPELDDGYVVHAPVGTYSANPFGLHEVAGNLWEWCLDGYDGGFYGRSPKRDPVSPWEGAADRVGRGGGFFFAAFSARSANRDGNSASVAVDCLGVRPARAIEQ